jgi:hypothetical protein
MKHFTINAENNITFHASRREAKATDGAIFSTEEQFADAIGNDNQRLFAIWNSLPGVKPVTKFANRKAATERIWKAIQNLGGPVATEPAPHPEAGAIKSDPASAEIPPQSGGTQAAPAIASPAPHVTSEPADDQPNIAPEPKTRQDAATMVAAPDVAASVGAQVADVAPSAALGTRKATRTKKAPTVETNAKVAREGSKTNQAIALMKRPGGVTLKQLMDTFGWQAHTVRGFVAGALTKKLGLTVASTKPEGGERTYSIAS